MSPDQTGPYYRPLQKSHYRSMKLNMIGRQVFPLSKNRICVLQGKLTRHRHFICIGNAVNPKRPDAQSPTKPNGNKPWCRASGNNCRRANPNQNPQNLQGHQDHAKLRFTTCFGHNPKIGITHHAAIFRHGRHIGNILFGKRIPQAKQLNPMPTTRGNCHHPNFLCVCHYYPMCNSK